MHFYLSHGGFSPFQRGHSEQGPVSTARRRSFGISSKALPLDHANLIKRRPAPCVALSMGLSTKRPFQGADSCAIDDAEALRGRTSAEPASQVPAAGSTRLPACHHGRRRIPTDLVVDYEPRLERRAPATAGWLTRRRLFPVCRSSLCPGIDDVQDRENNDNRRVNGLEVPYAACAVSVSCYLACRQTEFTQHACESPF
jgi:hypothetical protein